MGLIRSVVKKVVMAAAMVAVKRVATRVVGKDKAMQKAARRPPGK